MNPQLNLTHLLGPKGPAILTAMEAGLRFLDTHTPPQLLGRLGQQIDEVPPFAPIDKRTLQASFGGDQTSPSDDLLVGRGLFYLTEQRRLFLDCTSGHYQMVWGYNHPELCAAITEATRAGVIWDNHSNLPQSPLKQLADRLVRAANEPDERDPLDKVLLGVCTGSVACAAALKIQLKVYERDKPRTWPPVIVSLEGNYHGTDMAPQFMRGMWPQYARPFDVVTVPPNDSEHLEAVFRQHGERIAGFWAEPVMMNREAIAVNPGYLRLARQCCDRVGALLCLDEIQTGFWRPELFDFRALGLRPDLVVIGKGMTAGFHPLAGVIFKHRHDVLAQYDAISTNGSAALPAFLALCSMELIRQEAPRISAIARRIETGFQSLAAEFPQRLLGVQGRGHLAGLKFRTVPDAKEFQRRLLQAGLWTRVHAYHEGHSTLLTKLGLLADESIVDCLISTSRNLLKETANPGGSAVRCSSPPHSHEPSVTT